MNELTPQTNARTTGKRVTMSSNAENEQGPRQQDGVDIVDDQLQNFVNVLNNPEKRLLPLLFRTSGNGKQKVQNELVTIAKHLFTEMENVAKQYHHLNTNNQANDSNKAKDDKDAEEEEGDAIQALSGLDELFTGIGPELSTGGDKDRAAGEGVDAEMLWGQVELQNQAAMKLVKKSIKNFRKKPEKVTILDINQINDSDKDGYDDDADEDGNSDNDQGADQIESDDNSYQNSGDDDDSEEETRRIRERMERAMEDMDDSNEDEETNDETGVKKASRKKVDQKDDEEPLYDPIAEDMKDGFFDLNEMEDFADEEEDYLPDEAYGDIDDTDQETEKKNKKEEKSFHQKQRDGDLLEPDDDDEDDELDEEMPAVRRKKYREDDEIDTLYTLYQSPKPSNDDSDDDDENVINMTAADFFGRPDKKLMKRYKEKMKMEEAVEQDKDDDDSWGEYDFEKEDTDEGTGWREKAGKKPKLEDSSGSDAGSSNEEDGNGDENSQGDEKVNKSSGKKDNSNFEKQSKKLRLQTEELEREMIAEKPWHMTGETKSMSRPVNSLLESTPEFEMASKQAPAITVEHTANLEDVIKKRILAEDWDDVVPRELPDVGWHKKRGEVPEVSQEKSKLGLGELYEREYLKKAVGYDVDAEEKKSAEEKAQDEMKALFANLCSKLDALSNYHFAPRPIADEAEVRPVTTPAIAMEEVLPLHVSDSRGVAPEEVYATKRGRDGVLRGESEMDQVCYLFLFL